MFMQIKVQTAEQSESKTSAKKARALSRTAVHLLEVLIPVTKAGCQAGTPRGAAVFAHKIPPYELHNYALPEVLVWVRVRLPKV